MSLIGKPKLAMPKLAMPKLAVPKLAVPKLAVPKLAVPKLAVPKPSGKPIYKKMLTIHRTHQQKNLYNQLLITRTIPISINNIGSTIKETLGKAIASQIEGKCIVDGYIKPNSVEIITFSSGLVMGSSVIFEVVIQCEVCSPVEGMHIKCIAKHVNKAGIRAEINESPSPVVIFIARDHNYASALFAAAKPNDEINVRVIGQRFELNDKYISIIAEIVETEKLSSDTDKALTALPATALPATASLATASLATASLATALPAAASLATASLAALPVTEPSIKPVIKKLATIRPKKITVNN